MTTKRFFRMLRIGRRADSFSTFDEVSSQESSMQKDPLTIAMILLILLSLSTRLFYEVPLAMIKYFKGS
jgi:hypothetical protein